MTVVVTKDIAKKVDPSKEKKEEKSEKASKK